MKNSILIVGSLHGNELLGIRLYEYLKALHPELSQYVTYLCGNPRAFAENIRFIESDLNRSFSKGSATYEERRANDLQKMITSGKYDYILDVHTSTAEGEPFFISPALKKPREELISASHTIDKIVIMPENIAKNSLMGQFDNALSIEVNEDDALTLDTLTTLSAYLEAIITSKEQPSTTRQVFYVEDLLKPEDLQPNETPKNYSKLRSGYYPVLYGEINYKGYLGFKANRRRNITL